MAKIDRSRMTISANIILTVSLITRVSYKFYLLLYFVDCTISKGEKKTKTGNLIMLCLLAECFVKKLVQVYLIFLLTCLKDV